MTSKTFIPDSVSEVSASQVAIGRFFSLLDGRVGQYLSPRVLVVRTPFQKAPHLQAACYFGFDKLSQAQRFAQYLAAFGYSFSLSRRQRLSQFPYEVKVSGEADIAGVLAYWDRADQRRLAATQPRVALAA